MMLIHGLFGNLDNLAGLRRQFSDDYQILSVDLPDHGKSPYSQHFSFEEYSKQCVELLASLEINQINIIGHSLGGKVAMQIALSHPDLVTQLVVLDIAPVKYTSRHSNVFQGLNNVNLVELTSRKEADIALSAYVVEASTRQFLLKSLYQEKERWHWRFNLQLLQQEYSKLSAAIESKLPFSRPTLFVKGENSDYLLAEYKDAVLALFPNIQLKMISNTGHWLHAEKPELVAKVIKSFLNN